MVKALVLRIMMFFTSKQKRGCLVSGCAVIVCGFFLFMAFAGAVITVLIHYLMAEKLYYPMPTHMHISSPFDPERFHPIYHEISPHTGCDFPAPTGTSVYAAAAGIVIRVGFNNDEGNHITIEHENGLATRYKHLDEILVEEGQMVLERDLIGKCGNTGVSTGSHLHFEVKKDGEFVDPDGMLEEWPEDALLELAAGMILVWPYRFAML